MHAACMCQHASGMQSELVRRVVIDATRLVNYSPHRSVGSHTQAIPRLSKDVPPDKGYSSGESDSQAILTGQVI